MSIKNIQVYARIKIYRAETNVYTTFMHPYKGCIKYTNSIIRVSGGTHWCIFFCQHKKISAWSWPGLYFLYAFMHCINMYKEASGWRLAVCHPDGSQFLAEDKKVSNQAPPCWWCPKQRARPITRRMLAILFYCSSGLSKNPSSSLQLIIS